ncbi:MAG: amidohydrolase family protein [Desulfovibrionaceae bacterium]|nr:amidohydrolase family protein [Desulfovibrionaceae bacterium]
MKFDVHTHIFHPKIAHKAVEQLADHYGISVAGNGMADDLIARLDRVGIERMVTLVAATSPSQVIPANNWALEIARTQPRAVAFGTLHPEYADWEAELERLKLAGIRGLKFHADFQGFRMDDPRLLPIIEAAAPDFVMLFHVGDRLPPDQNPSCPFKMARLVRLFPRARFIAAHLGGYLHWQWALEVLAGKRLWLDTSSSLPFIDATLLRAIFQKHPREKFLYGSDYPISDPGDDVPLLQRRLGFGDAEIEELMENAGALF